MEDFKPPPISTLSGTTLKNFFRILKQGYIAPGFYHKIFLTALIVLVATPFHLWEEIVFSKTVKRFRFPKPPLFIIGHWRSGTTLLHNLLSKDPAAGYITTYQSLFPNNLASKWLFKTFMKLKMPPRRPSDRVVLNADFPQEDEFAFCNSQPNSYYNFFLFPSHYKTFYERSINFKELTQKEIDMWYSSYDKLLRKASINTKGERLIIKNPINTARIEKLLKLYPDAKFIFIYRNPVTVFLSTKRFFELVFPTVWLHKVDSSFIDSMIFDVYNRLMDGYLEQRSLIPHGNLLEVRFEELEQNPLQEMRRIYTGLLKEDFSRVESYFTEYIETQKEHIKNKYLVDAAEIEAIRRNWGRFMEMYDYDIPPDVVVKNHVTN